ncbi:helix-turn-helix domain-containing protein [Streptoalloteichus tenebrarius]|uniref:helix-turn-helix domain-containing protein n=1 Tax=Streptoalloteichus tenebrarius (strain ATCC 17920 / DSM 40477 / JCM 4838 / CBS 697.72 / NBRC 16177 / NCIMB 11028 / NRRL B-12390 / A12253. 1 / ISP 5477) TaxID=1933 RepID=UPI0035EC41F1
MSYLAGWRLALAADLLRETAATVGSIARRVGYSDAFALSVAFQRRRGVTPRNTARPRGPSVRTLSTPGRARGCWPGSTPPERSG